LKLLRNVLKYSYFSLIYKACSYTHFLHIIVFYVTLILLFYNMLAAVFVVGILSVYVCVYDRNSRHRKYWWSKFTRVPRAEPSQLLML